MGRNAKKNSKRKLKKGGKVVRKGDAEKKTDEAPKKKEDYRFSTGVLESRPTARDVKIGNFCLSAYGNELIQDATLELTIGRRYGLIGPNGCGKTQFLKCLAAREVPIPEFVDIFMLEHEAPPTEKTPIETAVQYMQTIVTDLENLAEKTMEDQGPESEVLQEIYERIDELEPSTFETRAAKLLTGLGFGSEMIKKKTKDLSGGWRMRVSLAQALLVKPMLLLLDEPTNHLDIETTIWLERYLVENFDKCLIVISHSQDFLNGVCTNIIHITPKKVLKVYSGNYDTYVKTREEQEVNQMKQYKKEQEDIKHIKQFVASCGTFSNLVKQAKSKLKILDKMEAKGLTEEVVKEAKMKFSFPQCDKLPPPILALYNVSFAYDGDLDGSPIYRNVDAGVNMDSRIALVGPNGAGKSTLVKLMTGELQPTEGSIQRHIQVRIGRYHQHSNEQLNQELSPLKFIQQEFPEEKKGEEHWRQHLGKYGIRGVMQKRAIGKLSDGLKSRIVFALMAYTQPNMIFLDEPTNHLDMDSIDALADAINNFNGGLVLVSHDFRLINQVAQEIWVCEKQKVTPWPGSILDYKKHLNAIIEKERKA